LKGPRSPGLLHVWALIAFLVLFVAGTTALLIFKTRVSPPPQVDLAARTADFHTLVSGSLLLAGLHPEEILAEESARRGEGRGSWNEYRTEILVGESFPFERWSRELEASLARAGARLETSRSEGETLFRVLYHPPGRSEPLPVETLTVRTRPTPEQSVPKGEGGAPRAALVMDDLGQSRVHLNRLAALGIPMTLSVLPGLPHSREIAEEAAVKGMEVLLHLPMEPVDFPEKRLGPGALLAEMTDAEIGRQLKEDLAAVPGAAGVNNHMGSFLTGDTRSMSALMKELKAYGLFFLDSRTTPHSLAFETAYRHNLPAAQRDIFLDAHDDEAFIRGQVRELLRLAQKRGYAIGIGHPYETTLSVLEEMREEIAGGNIEWVPVSSLTVQAYRPEEGSTRKSGRPGAPRDE
jgi:polysaccharide deacetylase 2 family uncharacterized protein YibQ